MGYKILTPFLVVALSVGPVCATENSTNHAKVVTPSLETARDQLLEYHPAAEGERIRKVVQRFSLNPYHFTQTSGPDLYQTTCQGCHMEDAKGASGAGHYPPLAGNPKLISKYYMISVLVNGYHGMPRFSDQMSDNQIAELVNYVRSNFGNQFPDEATPDDVKMMRGK